MQNCRWGVCTREGKSGETGAELCQIFRNLRFLSEGIAEEKIEDFSLNRDLQISFLFCSEAKNKIQKKIFFI